MTDRWLILADDLTGAADCAIAFARSGSGAMVSWGNLADDTHSPDVLAYDTDSRGLDVQAAPKRHSQALERLLSPNRILFKKIDSTLRGEPAAETAATLAFLQARWGKAFAILAPAFPSTGRTTVDGHVMVNGRPLEEAEVWHRDHTYPSADLVEMLATAGVAATRVPLEIIRGDGQALRARLQAIAAAGATVAVCDATTDQDLRQLAQASLPARQDTFFIGSAGLAHAIAAEAASEGGSDAATAVWETGSGGSLIVVGSLAATSRQGARKLVASGQVVHVPVTPAMLLEASAQRQELGRHVATLLGQDQDVLVEIQMDGDLDMTLGPQLAEGLATALEPVASKMRAFAATGGETASTLLSRFGVNGIHLIDEIEPGVALGLTRGKLDIPVVTKAGAFGDEDSLSRIATKLRAIRKNGIST